MDVGNMFDTQGEVLRAVQVRISKRLLPKINEEGCVEYGVLVPASKAKNRGQGRGGGADIEWIMKGSGSLSKCGIENPNHKKATNFGGSLRNLASESHHQKRR